MIYFRVSTASIALLILFSVLFSYLNIASGNRSIHGDPSISFEIDKEEAYVDVAPWTSGEANFTLTVHCQIPTEASADAGVEIRLNCSAWWWGVNDIPLMSFSKERKRMDVEITVSAFINTSADIVVDLEIWGDWQYTNSNTGGQIERYSVARIFVLPFYDLYVGSNTPVKYADIGDWTEFSFNISNRANEDVNITLELVKENPHLEIVCPNETLFMKRGETKTITIKVRQEPSRSRGNTIHVYARILEDPNETRWDLPLLYYTEPTFGTFFYERNFLRLVIIIVVIALVAVGLFLWERTKKEDGKKEIEEGSERRKRSPRSMDFSRK